MNSEFRLAVVSGSSMASIFFANDRDKVEMLVCRQKIRAG
jgi:hypothetical protein